MQQAKPFCGLCRTCSCQRQDRTQEAKKESLQLHHHIPSCSPASCPLRHGPCFNYLKEATANWEHETLWLWRNSVGTGPLQFSSKLCCSSTWKEGIRHERSVSIGSTYLCPNISTGTIKQTEQLQVPQSRLLLWQRQANTGFFPYHLTDGEKSEMLNNSKTDTL